MKNRSCSCEEKGCCFSTSLQDDPIEYVQHTRGSNWEETIREGEIFFILQGSLFISYGSFLEEIVDAGKSLLLPPGSMCTARTGEGVSFLKFRLLEGTRFCDQFSLEDLSDKEVLYYNHLPVLQWNPILERYLCDLLEVFQVGFLCRRYKELKIKELFYLLKVYYTKKELAYFFYPLLSRDASFAEFILKNYMKVKTVGEFAALYSCSLSNFDKKFKKTFGIPAYKWMMKKKVDFVFYQIKTTNKPFRQIAEETGFLSLPQFTDFCKKHLGNSPGKIRNNNGMEVRI